MSVVGSSAGTDASSAATPGTNGGRGDLQWTWGLVAIGLGVLGLLIAFALVAFEANNFDGTAALGVIASPIASIIGAYFGIHLSGNAAQAAQSQAQQAQQQTQAALNDKDDAKSDVATLLGKLEPAVADSIRSELKSL